MGLGKEEGAKDKGTHRVSGKVPLPVFVSGLRVTGKERD